MRGGIVRFDRQVYGIARDFAVSCVGHMIRARLLLYLSHGRNVSVAGIGLMWHPIGKLAQDETRDEQQNDRPAMKITTVHLRSVSSPTPSRNRGALGVRLQHVARPENLDSTPGFFDESSGFRKQQTPARDSRITLTTCQLGVFALTGYESRMSPRQCNLH